MQQTTSLLKLLIPLFLSLCLGQLSAQSTIGLYGSLNYGNLSKPSAKNFPDQGFEYQNTELAFGLIYQRKLENNVFLVIDLSYEKFDWLAKVLGPSDLNWKSQSINLSPGIQYSFLNYDRLTAGVLFSSKVGVLFNKREQLVTDSGNGIFYYTHRRDKDFGIAFHGVVQYKLNKISALIFRPGVSTSLYSGVKNKTYRFLSLDLGFAFSI